MTTLQTLNTPRERIEARFTECSDRKDELFPTNVFSEELYTRIAAGNVDEFEKKFGRLSMRPLRMSDEQCLFFLMSCGLCSDSFANAVSARMLYNGLTFRRVLFHGAGGREAQAIFDDLLHMAVNTFDLRYLKMVYVTLNRPRSLDDFPYSKAHFLSKVARAVQSHFLSDAKLFSDAPSTNFKEMMVSYQRLVLFWYGLGASDHPESIDQLSAYKEDTFGKDCVTWLLSSSLCGDWKWLSYRWLRHFFHKSALAVAERIAMPPIPADNLFKAVSTDVALKSAMLSTFGLHDLLTLSTMRQRVHAAVMADPNPNTDRFERLEEVLAAEAVDSPDAVNSPDAAVEPLTKKFISLVRFFFNCKQPPMQTNSNANTRKRSLSTLSLSLSLKPTPSTEIKVGEEEDEEYEMVDIRASELEFSMLERFKPMSCM